MKDFARLLNHPDISFSPIADAIRVDNPATGEALAFVRKSDSDGLKLLIQKAEAAQKLWAAKNCVGACRCVMALVFSDEGKQRRIGSDHDDGAG